MKQAAEIPEIWVSGAPSFVGGADTELQHQIVFWRKHNIAVRIVPTGDMDRRMKARMRRIGCRILPYRRGLFKGRVVVSYCNKESLKNLLDDSAGRPRAFAWFNCMTWTTPLEVEALRSGLITHLGFVSQYQRDYLLKEYAKSLPEMCKGGRLSFGRRGFPRLLDYSPWLDISQFSIVRKRDSYFGVGRISRDDPAKFSDDCWRIFSRVLAPGAKKVFILGYSKKIQRLIGPPPDDLDWQWWTAGAIPSERFFSKIDVLIHKTGGSRESYCRVFVEAMAHGVVPLAEQAFAFPELLQHSARLRDYLLCSTSDEMSYKASQLAFHEDFLKEMKRACRRYAERYFTRERPILKNWLGLLRSFR